MALGGAGGGGGRRLRRDPGLAARRQSERGLGRGRTQALQLERGQCLERTARLSAQLGLERCQAAPLADLATVFVHHAQVHEVVGREHVDLDVVAHDVELCRLAHQLQQHVHQVASAENGGLCERDGKTVGCRR